MTVLFTLSHINKSYIAEETLKDVSFRMDPGEKIGLIGVNGSGKSTLLKIISGDLSYDQGDFIQQKDLKIGYLTQESSLESDKTVLEEAGSVFRDLDLMERRMEELTQAMGQKEGSALEAAMKDYAQVLEAYEEAGGYSRHSTLKGTLLGLGFKEEEFNQVASTLSGGQKARLALAKLLLTKPDLLLLDEPTNHLDIDAINWLEKFLRDYRGSLMVISHDRYFLDRVVGRILLLEFGQVYSYQGNYTDFMKKRKKDLDIRQRAYENQQKEIKRQEEIIQRYESWNRERSIRQAQSRQKQLDKMDRLENIQEVKKARIHFEPRRRSGKDVLQVQEVSKAFEDKALFEDLSFSIYRGERVGLIGPNGVGKSTLFQMIMDRTPYSGQIQLGAQVEIGYFDQEMASLDETKTIMEEIWDAYPQLTHYEIRTYLAQFLFVGDDLVKEISSLSGGEKGRLSLLKLMLGQGNFLLLDEPTNHLDIDSKEILEEALRNYTGSILAISHDRYFLNAVCQKTLVLDPEGLRVYEGNYDYYLEKLEALRAEEEDPQEGDLSRTEKDRIKKERRLSQKERRQKKAQKKDLEAEIARLEARQEDLEETLSLPESYEDHQRAFQLAEDLEATKKTLEALYQDWVLLEEDLED
ncbi:MAG: ABC-F family ATP-binding cassette domain-containing protein [Tissierellia bacterium]|nr:ABC-F family ATP-binding cassette domain-containing protein [Tissierellia bacterium]